MGGTLVAGNIFVGGEVLCPRTKVHTKKGYLAGFLVTNQDIPSQNDFSTMSNGLYHLSIKF